MTALTLGVSVVFVDVEGDEGPCDTAELGPGGALQATSVQSTSADINPEVRDGNGCLRMRQHAPIL